MRVGPRVDLLAPGAEVEPLHVAGVRLLAGSEFAEAGGEGHRITHVDPAGRVAGFAGV